MKFHLSQNNRNEITLATSFISGCIMYKLQEIDQTLKWKYFTLPEMQFHVNTLQELGQRLY